MSDVSVRYMIDDVPAAVTFYTTLLGFRLEQDASPAFAALSRDGVSRARRSSVRQRRSSPHCHRGGSLPVRFV